MSYCADASALIDAWRDWYSIDIVPSFWDNVEALIYSGELVSPYPVLWELERGNDDLYKWVKDRDTMFVELHADLQIMAKSVCQKFGAGALVDLKKDRGIEADPFIVALAILDDHTVITHESITSPKKIPAVCRHYGVRCIRIPEFVREQQWVFR